MMKELIRKKYYTRIWLYCCSLVVLLFIMGCSSPDMELFPAPEVSLVWPKPPDKPRIKYVGSISTEADLKRAVSWSQSLTQFIFGKKKTGVLLSPYSVTMDQKDRMFVADAAGALVHMFDLDSRAYKQLSVIDGGQRLQMPVAITAVDNDVYVVDSVAHKVCVFDETGRFAFSFGAEKLKRPAGIAYWPDGKLVYVADAAGHKVCVFDKDGEFIRQIGSRGPESGKFNFPTHLWVDQSGNLFVSDTLNYRIQVFSSEGKFLEMFGKHGDRPGYFAHPSGVASDSFGNIYVIDRQFENLQVFDKQGRILMALGGEGSDSGQFWLPAGIHVDKRNRIYIADSFNKRVQIFELMEANQ